MQSTHMHHCGNSSGLLPKFEPERFSRLLENKTLVFIGDSVTGNQAMDLMVLLRRYILEIHATEPATQGGACGMRQGTNFTPFPTKVVEVKNHTEFLEPNIRGFCSLRCSLLRTSPFGTGAVCLIFAPHWEEVTSVVRHVLNFLPGHSILFVVNVGAWYRDRHAAHYAHTFNELLDSWSKWVRSSAIRRSLLLTWRETAPQHFPPGGMLMTRTNATIVCVASNEPDWRNRGLIRTLQKRKRGLLRFSILRIWDISNAHPEEHPGNGDCTHWCSLGIPRIWSTLLHQQLADVYPLQFQTNISKLVHLLHAQKF
eukprot:TRINITY_DN7432_c0_g1_i2.p1 TRINITY_DN7432_c0_g1~~TRINITY_DN7432_c0_g1_i2.p1  ORF type:complete len:347 (-),score=30.94 TRINITY_DN7432_c0_g1_i2:180-1115(-)